jgi:hypothetical protein
MNAATVAAALAAGVLVVATMAAGAAAMFEAGLPLAPEAEDLVRDGIASVLRALAGQRQT